MNSNRCLFHVYRLEEDKPSWAEMMKDCEDVGKLAYQQHPSVQHQRLTKEVITLFKVFITVFVLTSLNKNSSISLIRCYGVQAHFGDIYVFRSSSKSIPYSSQMNLTPFGAINLEFLYTPCCARIFSFLLSQRENVRIDTPAASASSYFIILFIPQRYENFST